MFNAYCFYYGNSGIANARQCYCIHMWPLVAFEVVQNYFWRDFSNTMDVFKRCVKNVMYVGNIEVMTEKLLVFVIVNFFSEDDHSFLAVTVYSYD
jgi:hypothetical protein